MSKNAIPWMIMYWNIKNKIIFKILNKHTCRCPVYQNIPSICRLETPPGKCCQEPVCTFSNQYGTFSGVGTISGNGTGIQNLSQVEWF